MTCAIRRDQRQLPCGAPPGVQDIQQVTLRRGVENIRVAKIQRQSGGEGHVKFALTFRTPSVIDICAGLLLWRVRDRRKPCHRILGGRLRWCSSSHLASGHNWRQGANFVAHQTDHGSRKSGFPGVSRRYGIAGQPVNKYSVASFVEICGCAGQIVSLSRFNLAAGS